MSKIIAIVEQIQNIDNLNIVTFSCGDVELKMMSLDINVNIKVGKKVLLNCKPSSISIAKDFEGQISISNILQSKVLSILKGELLSIVTLDFQGFKLESLITSKAIEKIQLKENENVSAFVKASELYIVECIDE